jgi:hypothetical protein
MNAHMNTLRLGALYQTMVLADIQSRLRKQEELQAPLLLKAITNIGNSFAPVGNGATTTAVQPTNPAPSGCKLQQQKAKALARWNKQQKAMSLAGRNQAACLLLLS